MSKRKNPRHQPQRERQEGTRDLPWFLRNLAERVQVITKKDQERWNPKRSLIDLRAQESKS